MDSTPRPHARHATAHLATLVDGAPAGLLAEIVAELVHRDRRRPPALAARIAEIMGGAAPVAYLPAPVETLDAPGAVAKPRRRSAAKRAGHDAALSALRESASRGGGIPYGASVLPENSFAAACYNDNPIDTLALDTIGAADRGDLNTWNLSPTQWAEQIGAAYAAMTWDREIDAVDPE